MDTSLSIRVKQLLQEPDSVWLTLYRSSTEEVQFSNLELHDRIIDYLSYYRDKGLKEGATVLIILENSKDLICSFLAAIVYGAMPAFYAYPNPKHSVEQFVESVKNLVKYNPIDLLVTYEEITKVILSESHDYSDRIRTVVNYTDVPKGDFLMDQLEISSERFLQFSSGTTGAKKGVKVSVTALFNQVSAYQEVIKFDSSSKVVSWLPHYHDMGLIACLLMPFIKNVPVVLLSPFAWVQKPILLFEAIKKHKGTHLWMPNFAFGHSIRSIKQEDLEKIDLSSVRKIVSCSEPLLYDTYSNFVASFNGVKGFDPLTITNCYAMAENTFAMTSSRNDVVKFLEVDYQRLIQDQLVVPKEGGYKISSVGEPLKNIELVILDDKKNRVLDNQIGEIHIKSDCMLEGYHNNPEETGSSMHEQYFNTGDLGFFNEGELYVTGRKKDMIIVGGENIYPQDIEQIINHSSGSLPGRNVVFGSYDQRVGTERIVALIEAEHIESFDSIKLKKTVFNNLGVSLSEILMLPPRTLVKSTAGKISRQLNKIAFEKGVLSKQIAQGNQDEKIGMIENIKLCVGKVCGTAPKDITPEMNIFENGLLDSFGLIDLVVELETCFSCKIPIDAVNAGSFGTIGAIQEFINRIKSGEHFDLELDQITVQKRSESFNRLQLAPPAGAPKSTVLEKLLNNFPFPKSFLYQYLLRLVGIKVGRGVLIQGRIFFKIRGNASNITIGDYTRIGDQADFRIRENGKIILESKAVIDNNVRIVAARDGFVKVGEGAEISTGTIINSGGETTIGAYTLIAGNCNINSSSHSTDIGQFIRESSHVHGKIAIGPDVWIGSGASILMNTEIGEGVVVSSNALVRGHLKPFGIYAGVPAVKIGNRKI